MRLRLLVRGLAALAAVLLVVGLIEVSSLATERRAARAARDTLFTDALEPELPIASEVAPADPIAAPALTR